MFRYSKSALALAVLASGAHSFQTPKPSKTLASLDASYIERTLEWPDLFEIPSEGDKDPLISFKNQASIAVAPPAPVTPNIDLSKVSNILTPAEAFESLVAKGEYNAAASIPKTLFSSILGGCYVGMGAMLSLAVAGNSPELGAADPGLQKLLFAGLFPVNLLLALQCGGQLYTGNTANMMAAACEGRANLGDMARSLGLSWVGNAIGCGFFAVACKYAGVLEGGAGHLAAATLATKTSYELGPLFVKAMFCNWLVCLAVFLSMQAKDMTGKYLSIWLPVSTFVSIGFEHSVANMFLLPAGLMSTDEISVQTALFHNLLPVTLGNAVSGSLFVGAAMSYMYGKLGDEEPTSKITR
jgi:formate/nitrite transporter